MCAENVYNFSWGLLYATILGTAKCWLCAREHHCRARTKTARKLYNNSRYSVSDLKKPCDYLRLVFFIGHNIG